MESDNNKQAVITGASKGIGRSFTTESAKRGYDLFIIAGNKMLLEELAIELRNKYRVHVTTIAADLSKVAEVKSLVAKLSNMTAIELLINNTGLTRTEFHKTEALKRIKGTDKKVKAMAPDDVVKVSFDQLGKKLIVVPGIGNRISLLFKEQIANGFNKKLFGKA